MQLIYYYAGRVSKCWGAQKQKGGGGRVQTTQGLVGHANMVLFHFKAKKKALTGDLD